MKYLKKKFGTLILASESPRRAAILRQVGFDFLVHPSRVEETYNSSDPVDIAKELAEKKAKAVSAIFQDQIVLGADTIVVLDQHILGKPMAPDDAAKMLMLLSGRTHQVYTAYCLIHENRKISVIDFSRTDVTFRILDREEVDAYIATGSPMDKAGAYGIQDGSAVFIDHIDGDFYNVVGLPVTSMYQTLFAYFNHHP